MPRLTPFCSPSVCAAHCPLQTIARPLEIGGKNASRPLHGSPRSGFGPLPLRCPPAAKQLPDSCQAIARPLPDRSNPLETGGNNASRPLHGSPPKRLRAFAPAARARQGDLPLPSASAASRIPAAATLRRFSAASTPFQGLLSQGIPWRIILPVRVQRRYRQGLPFFKNVDSRHLLR